MTTKSKRTLPVFHEDMLYKAWKNKLNIGQIITSFPKKEQGIVVLLDSLEGNAKAEKTVADMKAEEINNDDSIKVITDKLDQIFLKESADEAYKVYSNFINYNKSNEITKSKYIHFYKKMIEHGMKLPDPVLTFKLLDGANIFNNERKLALKFCVNLKYKKKKSALKQLFAPSSSTSMQNTTNEIKIKQEEAFF